METIKKAWDNGYECGLSEGAKAERERYMSSGGHVAYSNGLTDGIREGQTRVLKMMEEMCNEDVADAVTFGQYATAHDLLEQLKQRLENNKTE